MNFPTDHIERIKEFGYTESEARFLYIVAVHSGYFTLGQFRAFTGAAYGKRPTSFAQKVLKRGHATIRDYLRRGSIFHLLSRTIYGQIDKDILRNRKRHSFDFMRSRLVLLDFILANQDLNYFETEQDKVRFFCDELGVSKDSLPVKVYEGGPDSKPTLRYFVDKFPLFFSLPFSDRRDMDFLVRARFLGQNGYIEKSGNWYVVRWRMDVGGQENRRYLREKICPLSGPGKLSASERERKAKEIVERSGANSEQHFNRVVLGETTFREQARFYLQWAVTRDREPIKDAASIKAALHKWILPAIGDMPLGSLNNITVKPVVDKMKKSKSLSARTVNKYVEYIKQVVASLKHGETGEPIHKRTWDSSVMDLPMVNQKEQRRPSLKAKAITQLVEESGGEEKALYVLLAATGMRISEALALETIHITNHGRTIEVRQQVERDTPRIITS